MGGEPDRVTRNGSTPKPSGGQGQTGGQTSGSGALHKALRTASGIEEQDQLVTAGLEDRQAAPLSAADHVRLSTVIDAVPQGLDRLEKARITSVKQVAVLAESETKSETAIDIITNLVSSVASAMTGGVSTIVTRFIKEDGLKFIIEKSLGAASAAATKIAENAVGDAIRDAKTPEQKRKLFFLSLEQEITHEIGEAVSAFLEDTYKSGKVPDGGPAAIKAAFDAAKPGVVALQEREARRAWLVFQAQQKLGKSPRAGVPVEKGAKPGGTRLGVDGSGGVPGVLQVEVDPQKPSQILRAELGGLGDISAGDIKQTPLGELNIPIRFAAEGMMGETRYGIFVNESGMAVVQGRALEHHLYRLGGGDRKLGPRDEIHPNERHFVDAGLKNLTARLLSQRLGDKLDL